MQNNNPTPPSSNLQERAEWHFTDEQLSAYAELVIETHELNKGQKINYTADDFMQKLSERAPTPADTIEGEVPEELLEWIGNQSVKTFGPHTPKNAYFHDGAIAMWRKMQELVVGLSAHLKALQARVEKECNNVDAANARIQTLQNSLDREVDRFNAVSVERYEYRTRLQTTLTMLDSMVFTGLQANVKSEVKRAIETILEKYPNPF